VTGEGDGLQIAILAAEWPMTVVICAVFLVGRAAYRLGEKAGARVF